MDEFVLTCSQCGAFGAESELVGGLLTDGRGVCRHCRGLLLVGGAVVHFVAVVSTHCSELDSPQLAAASPPSIGSEECICGC